MKSCYTTGSEDIPHYAASTGAIYAAPLGISESVNLTNDSFPHVTTDMFDGGLESNVTSVHTLLTNGDVTPPPPPLPPILTRFNSTSSCVMGQSPQQKVFATQRLNMSSFSLADPYLQPRPSPTKQMFKSRSSTMPRLDLGCSNMRPSSARVSHSHQHPQNDVFPYHISATKLLPHSPTMQTQPSPYETSLATIPASKEPASSHFDQSAHPTHLLPGQNVYQQEAYPYMEPSQFRDAISLQQEAFPYADPVSISPTKEMNDSPRPVNGERRPSNMPLQWFEEGAATPYMDPSPIVRQRKLGDEDQFRERVNTGSTTVGSEFIYIPPEVRLILPV